MNKEKLNFDDLKKHEKAYDIFRLLLKIDPNKVIMYIENNWVFRFMYAYPNTSIEVEIKSYEEYVELIDIAIKMMKEKYWEYYYLKK